MNRMLLSYEMEKSYEWEKWRKEIPSIKFPASWKIKIMPPFSGAVIRFCVVKPGNKNISVYLDCYDNLGHFGSPHWEVYPDKDGSNSRFEMNDVEGMLKCSADSKESL